MGEREGLYRVFAVKSALPFHASFSLTFLPLRPLSRNLPHPRESFRRMKTLLFMRHVQACRGFSGKGTARDAIRAARARAPSCM